MCLKIILRGPIMWFKNAQIYTVDLSDEHKRILTNPELLESTIKEKSYRPCQAQEVATLGFSPLFGRLSELYTFNYGPCYFFRIIEETKLLPSQVVKTELENLIEEKEATLGRELRKNEIQSLKTALINQLLTRAFSSQRDMLVMLNIEKSFCLVSVSSAKRAEKAIAMLREAFSGTFPARHFQPRCVVEDRMTSWLTDGQLPQVFTLGFDTTLKSSDEEGGTIKASKEDLRSEEITMHLAAGKVVTELQLTFEDSLSFVLTSELALKRMRPEDQYLEQNLPEKTEDAIADLEAHLILQADLLTKVTDTIKGTFDCE